MGVDIAPPFQHTSLPLPSPVHDYVTAEATILVGVLVVFYLTVILLLFGSNLACPRSLFPSSPAVKKAGAETVENNHSDCDTCIDIERGHPTLEGENRNVGNEFGENSERAASSKIYRGNRNSGLKYDYCSIDAEDDFGSNVSHVETCKMCQQEAIESDEFVDTDDSDDDEDYSYDDTLVVDRKGEYSISYYKKQCNDIDEINWNVRSDPQGNYSSDVRQCRCVEPRYAEIVGGQQDYNRYKNLYRIENQETMAIRQEKLRNLEQQLRAHSRPVPFEENPTEIHREKVSCECLHALPRSSSASDKMSGHLRSKLGMPSRAMRAPKLNESLAQVHYPPHNRPNYLESHSMVCKCTTLLHTDTYIGHPKKYGPVNTNRNEFVYKQSRNCGLCDDLCVTCSETKGIKGAENNTKYEKCDNFTTSRRFLQQDTADTRTLASRRHSVTTQLNRWASSYESPPGHRLTMPSNSGNNGPSSLKNSTSDSFLSNHVKSCKVCSDLSVSKMENAHGRTVHLISMPPSHTSSFIQKETATPVHESQRLLKISSPEINGNILSKINGEQIKEFNPQKNKSKAPMDSAVKNEQDVDMKLSTPLTQEDKVAMFSKLHHSVSPDEKCEVKSTEIEKTKDEDATQHANLTDNVPKKATESSVDPNKFPDYSKDSKADRPSSSQLKSVREAASSQRTAIKDSLDLEVVLLEERSGHVATHLASV
ncbi:uncharacterized protein LOC108681804 [Hyalella azteca]|uniref:Uncharacterized protein LOC108681804 n=1 Tax=Hyalella azteca TaxID=294128 RepID=A0A8B7PLT7_HYAAZ|nr:uncharacterized protein LOC108681804 [Hyalella azteca]